MVLPARKDPGRKTNVFYHIGRSNSLRHGTREILPAGPEGHIYCICLSTHRARYDRIRLSFDSAGSWGGATLATMTGSDRPSQPSRPPCFYSLGLLITALAAGSVLFLVCTATHAGYDVEIDTPKSIHSLLERHLGLSCYKDRRDITGDQLRYMIETTDDQVTKLTVTEDYFVPRAIAKLDGPPDHRVVDVRAEPGPYTTIDIVVLDFTGATMQDAKRIGELKRLWSLQCGMVFRQSGWDRAKNDGLMAL